MCCPDHEAFSQARTIAFLNKLQSACFRWLVYKSSDSGLFWLLCEVRCQHKSVVSPDPFGLLSLLSKMNCSSFIYEDESLRLSYVLGVFYHED